MRKVSSDMKEYLEGLAHDQEYLHETRTHNRKAYPKWMIEVKRANDEADFYDSLKLTQKLIERRPGGGA